MLNRTRCTASFYSLSQAILMLRSQPNTFNKERASWMLFIDCKSDLGVDRMKHVLQDWYGVPEADPFGQSEGVRMNVALEKRLGQTHGS